MEERDIYAQPWVILKLKEELYGIDCAHVQSMVAMPEVVAVPHSPSWCRGVINLRGEVIRLVDLRQRLGMESFLVELEDMVELMRQREQDHRNWLKELEQSVHDRRPFTLATDPHKCKFGQWFDHYTPVSSTEARFLEKFPGPHGRIHGIAAKVEALKQQGRHDKALTLIERTHNGDLAHMIRLFKQFRQLIRDLRRTEIALVLHYNNQKTALAVDAIESVEMLAPGSVEPLADALQQGGSRLARLVGKRKKSREIVYLLEADLLLSEESAFAADSAAA